MSAATRDHSPTSDSQLAQLEYARADERPAQETWLRGCALSLVWLWSVWFTYQFRSMNVGTNVRMVFALLCFVAVLGFPWLPFIGLSLRRVAVGTLLTCVFSVCSTEMLASAQEVLVKLKHGSAPSTRVDERRWFVRGHGIHYSPGVGWWGSD